MSELERIASVPGVRSAVLGDLGGAFLGAAREPDGETVAAVMGFLANALLQVGEQLGLGALRRVVIANEARACVVAVRGTAVTAARVEPPGALATVEKVLDSTLQGRG